MNYLIYENKKVRK